EKRQPQIGAGISVIERQAALGSGYTVRDAVLTLQYRGLRAMSGIISRINFKRARYQNIGSLQVGRGVGALHARHAITVIRRELDQSTHVAGIDAQRSLAQFVVE